jgi:hypothetical protein
MSVDKEHTRHSWFEHINKKAIEQFKDHEVTKVGANTWRCGKPDTSLSSFYVISVPGRLIMYGDIGDLSLALNSEGLKWLLNCSYSDINYMYGKIWADDPDEGEVFLIKEAYNTYREHFGLPHPLQSFADILNVIVMALTTPEHLFFTGLEVESEELDPKSRHIADWFDGDYDDNLHDVKISWAHACERSGVHDHYEFTSHIVPSYQTLYKLYALLIFANKVRELENSTNILCTSCRGSGTRRGSELYCLYCQGTGTGNG